MRFSSLYVGLALATGISALGRRQDAPVPGANDTQVVKDRYIFEFDQSTDVAAVTARLGDHLPGATVRKVFDSDVFKGVSVDTLDDVDVFKALGNFGGVVNVWPAHVVQLSPAERVEMPAPSEIGNGDYSVHHMTGVDKLHEAGVLGKGAVIAIVDSGIDYNHPALGGGFGPGFKVAGGWDFAGDGSWPQSGEKQPDADPMDHEGHGTHVAGIAAGNMGWFKGVAPEATILAYKTFARAGGTDEETLIEAFLRAFDDGADVITASVGWAYNWSHGAWGHVASRLVENGVVCTISAGNDGFRGPFYGSSGSSGKYVTAVASVDPDVWAAYPFTATVTDKSGKTQDVTIGYLPARGGSLFGSSIKGLPVHVVPQEAWASCSRLPAQGVDLARMVVLTPRTAVCDYSSQISSLRQQGARYIVFYNDDQVLAEPIFDTGVTLGLIDQPNGKILVDALAAGSKVTFSFPRPDGYVKIHNPSESAPSYYTSWGPTFELEQKPDIAAPGQWIFSTYPGSSWATLSGTSMSTPYVAGVAALYVGKYGGRKSHGPGFGIDLTARILSSGKTVPSKKGSKFFASTALVGTGLIDAVKVLEYDTRLSFAKWHLNDTSHFSPYHSVDITNNGAEDVTYSFELQPAAGFETFERDPSRFYLAPSILEDLGDAIEITPAVRMPAGVFRVQPGQTRKAEWTFTPPTGDFDRTRIPLYSGKMLIKSSNGEQLSVPYVGVAGDIKQSVAKNDDIWWFEYPHLVSGIDLKPWKDKPFWTFDLSPEKQDFPTVLVASSFGTPLLRWDVYEANWSERRWSYPPVVGENGFVGTVMSYREAFHFGYIDPKTQDVTDLVPAVSQWQTRQQLQSFWWFGQLANGSDIAPGNYTMRAAVLLPFGNPEASDNWVVLDAPQIQILPKS